jgi:hypothetical protein
MVQMCIRRSIAVVMAVALIAAGCGVGDDESDGTSPPATPAPTLGGVGAAPAMPSAVRDPVVVVRPPINADGTEADLIGSIVDGNRVLMIGDSILASTSSRYGNHMCGALVPLGWQVAVEAEPSRFVEFGNQVLDKLLRDDADPDQDWDAAVVFLGTNYRGDAKQYETELVEILDRLTPRPVVLFTVTEYRSNYVEVNEVVDRLGAVRDNVNVLDWKTISEAPGILSNDRLHPTDTGRRVLAESVAAALGPVAGDGECVRSTFRDDSAIRGDRSTVLGRPSTTSDTAGSVAASTSTTTPAATTTSTVATGSGGAIATPTTSPSSGVTTTMATTTSLTTVPTPTPTPTSTSTSTTAPPAPELAPTPSP